MVRGKLSGAGRESLLVDLSGSQTAGEARV